MKTVTLPRDIYDELHALVKWQFDAPVPLPTRVMEDCDEVEANIWERANVGVSLFLTSFDEGMELVAEDDDGEKYSIVKGGD